MKSMLYSLALRILRKFGYEITKETSRDDLLEFLRSQLPLETSLDLIRLGSPNDGGYILPNALDGISKCISPGCNQEVTFETELLEKYGISSVIIDKAEARPKQLSDSHEYIAKWLGSNDSESTISLSTILNSQENKDLMLQMDIEGAEYEILLGLPSSELERFRIILIEFHFLSNLRNKVFFEYVFKSIFQKISKTHTLVHAHPNNCAPSWSHRGILYPEVMEYSYIRNDQISKPLRYAVLPNKLDAPNILGNPEPVISLK